MTSTPLTESSDQTPEQGAVADLPNAEVARTLEHLFDIFVNLCAKPCENPHQKVPVGTTGAHTYYYELVGDAHRQGFDVHDDADHMLRGYTR